MTAGGAESMCEQLQTARNKREDDNLFVVNLPTQMSGIGANGLPGMRALC